MISSIEFFIRFCEWMPTANTKKSEMIVWLNSNGVYPDKKLLKPEIFKLVKDFGINRKHVIDEMIKESGHEILRLPPYHAHLNPIGSNFFLVNYLLYLVSTWYIY